jgi:hypothetical protein
MKKIILFLTLCFGLLGSPYAILGQTQDYVYIKNKKFMLNGEKWFPITMNYIVDVVYQVDEFNDTTYFIAPYHDYGATFYYDCDNEMDCFNQLVSDFQLLANNGFNSVRIVGEAIEYGTSCDNNATSGYRYCPLQQNGPVPTQLVREFVYPRIPGMPWPNQNAQSHPFIAPYTDNFSYAQKILDAADIAGLKVQFLIGGKRITELQYKQGFIDYLDAFSSHFSNNTTLYSYDLYNEPLYNQNSYDIPNYPENKNYICNLVDEWNNTVQNNAPDHLTTIGLTGYGEINNWDPGNLHLDFLSFHVYPYSIGFGQNLATAFNAVKSDLRWIAETSELPWIIGESGFKASSNNPLANDWGTETEQADFAEQTLNFIRDNGGSGYSWWLFSDEAEVWGNNWGLIDRARNLKPMLASKFNNFNPYSNTNSSIADGIHYNNWGYSTNSITGIVKDQYGSPIKNAVIQCWSTGWSNATHTYSKPDGTYTIYSNSSIDKIKISAVKSTISTFDFPSSPLNVTLNQVQPGYQYINGAYLSTNYEQNGFLIVSNSIVYNTYSCSMKASHAIQLNTGFKAEYGSFFEAYISPMQTSCNLVSSASRMNNNKPISPKKFNV